MGSATLVGQKEGIHTKTCFSGRGAVRCPLGSPGNKDLLFRRGAVKCGANCMLSVVLILSTRGANCVLVVARILSRGALGRPGHVCGMRGFMQRLAPSVC